MNDRLGAIYDSFINGQFKQMNSQIKRYGEYNLWPDLRDALRDTWTDSRVADGIILDIVIRYHRTKGN